MARIIRTLLLLLLCSVAYGQSVPGYTNINSGYKWPKGIFDSSFVAPRYGGVPSGLRGGAQLQYTYQGSGHIGIDTVDHNYYFYSDGWVRLAKASDIAIRFGVSGEDATAAQNRSFTHSGFDFQLFAQNGSKYQEIRSLTDSTLGMHLRNLSSNDLAYVYLQGSDSSVNIKGGRPTHGSAIRISDAGIVSTPFMGLVKYDSLNHSVLATDKMVVWDSATGNVATRAVSAGSVITESDDNLALSGDVLSTNTTFQSLSDGATITFTTANGINGSVTIAGNRTLSIPSPQNGKTYTVKVTQDGTGGGTLQLPGGSMANLNLTAGATTTISGLYDGSVWVWMSNAGGPGSLLSTETTGAVKLGGSHSADSTTLDLLEKKFRFANATKFQLDLTNDSTDAAWDMFVRDSLTGYIVRVPKGTPGQVLTMQSTTGPQWQTPGAGSADGNTVVISSDVASAASTSPQDITGLEFTAVSGTLYEFETVIFYTASDATIGMNLGCTGPASPTFITFSNFIPQTATAAAQNHRPDYSTPTGSNATPSAIGQATIKGWLKTSSTGTFKIQFAPETATASGIVIKAGTRIKYWERVLP